mmetsp:Transcript_61266/g.113736  ORF Transcript_61266/g.113736 Transcript_61266/m.113736 type:complete len:206 (+) Transcript_61266:175-792(+)
MSTAAQLAILCREEQASKKREASERDGGFSDVSEDEDAPPSRNGPTRFGLRRKWLLKEKRLLEEKRKREEELLKKREAEKLARMDMGDEDSDDGSAMSDVNSAKEESDEDLTPSKRDSSSAMQDESPLQPSTEQRPQVLLSPSACGEGCMAAGNAGGTSSMESPSGSAATAVRSLRKSHLKKPAADGSTSPSRTTSRVSFREEPD